jgi:hypothetical protein
MRIEPHIAGRHWEAAAAEQIEETLRAQGYEVKRGARFDDLQADLVARKGDEILIYEFKAPRKGGEDWAQQVALLRERAVAQGARFYLVFVRPPRESRIEIEGIDAILKEALSAHMPRQLRALSRNSGAGDVSQVMIGRIEVRPQEIEVEGEATVAVDLMSNEHSVLNEYFAFTFDIVLDGDGHLTKVVDLEVDLSSLLGRPGASPTTKKKPLSRGGG